MQDTSGNPTKIPLMLVSAHGPILVRPELVGLMDENASVGRGLDITSY